MANKPNIRFKGFTEDWEQRKLGELGSLKNGMNFSKDAMGHGYHFVNLQNILGNNVVNVNALGLADATEKQLLEYTLIEGDVLFVRSSVKLEGVGEAALVPESLENTTYSGFIIRFRDEYGLNNDFKKYIFGTQKVRNQIMSQATNSANKNISQGVLENLTFEVPSFDEQAKIGEFFTNLDYLITLHQRKCDDTKKLKKYMLQKMFPKNGEKKPEIRFAGFTDDWEQRKLGDVTKEFKSGNALKADKIDTTGEYPVYGGNGLRGYTSTYNHDGEFALIGRQGALCGNTNYSVGKAYFTEHAVVVKTDENNDTKFMYYMLDTMNLGQYSDQSAQPGLAVNKLVKLENLFPKKEEQQRIGLYFKSLDHLITLHQRKCDDLKNLKKYMLQNMFV